MECENNIVDIQVKGFKCLRCEETWIPKNLDNPPVVCPKCSSPYWNKPRKNKKSN